MAIAIDTAKRASTPAVDLPGDPEFRHALGGVLPGPIVFHGDAIDALQAPLHPEEALAVRGAVDKRVREFTAGRTAARAALARLGYEDVTIPVGKRRQPVWPAGVTGSISHGGGYCVAAACTRNHVSGLGVDIELATPLSDRLVDLVCTAEEQRRIARAGSMGALLAKFVFSAKEAVFKCLYPVYGEELEFHDVSLDISLGDGRFTAHVPSFVINAANDLELTGRFACTSRLVITAVVLHDEDVQHLTGWNPRLDGCDGRFVCGTGRW